MHTILGRLATRLLLLSIVYEGSSDLEEFSSEGETLDEIDLVACKPVAFEMHQSTPGVLCVKDGEPNWTPVVWRRKRGSLSSGPKNDSSDKLDIGAGRQDTTKCMAKFPVSTFPGVAPDLVCLGFPLQPAQYPLEPELESSISLLLHTVSMKKKSC